jgi:hypothetical protein
LNKLLRKAGLADTAAYMDVGIVARIAAAKIIAAKRLQHECRNDREHRGIVIPTRSLELTKIILGLSLLLFGSGIWATVSGGSLSQNKGAWVTHASR